MIQDVIISSILIAVLDIPWLLLTQEYVGKMIQSIQGSPLTMRLYAAPIVYLALGYLLRFPKTVYEAFAMGFSVYAVYDFTNYATIAKYKLPFAIADSTWGGILTGVAWSIKQKLL